MNEEAIYRTHQGVKGNEFARVMAIESDQESGGFLFSYEQLFGGKDPSANTLAKMAAGEDTGLSRTRRLFYVTSTRAMRSLAHVIYTANLEGVRESLISQGLAMPEEVITVV